MVTLYGLSTSRPSGNRACRKAWLSLLATYRACTRPIKPARSKSASLDLTSLQEGEALRVVFGFMSGIHVLPIHNFADGVCEMWLMGQAWQNIRICSRLCSEKPRPNLLERSAESRLSIMPA